MKVFYTDFFEIPLPDDHRFPALKYPRLRERLVRERVVEPHELLVPEPATGEQLERAHERAYVENVFRGSLGVEEQRRIGLPWSPALVERAVRSVGATIAACRAALEDGHAVYLGGGTHHAFAGHGAGFCVFNDAPVALRDAQADGRLSRAAILDCDVHQGDGTASILQDDPSIFTLSIHGERNYPFRKERSDLDIPLPTGTGDDAYLDAVRRGVGGALERSRAELAVYLAGADPYSGDRLGKLDVSEEALAERERIVLDACARHGVPVAVVMAGGYAHDIDETVEIQATTVRLVAERHAGRQT